MKPPSSGVRAIALALAALGVALSARPAGAESLISTLRPDLLSDLGAPEAAARTRRGLVIYPAPGLPALLRAGQEVIARVRVRRAMTPPPGIQQPNVVQDWRAALVGRGHLTPPGTPAELAFPIQVSQIRPDDDGFLYRFRLEVPAYIPAGVYDLDFEGPGVRDLRPRSVRVLDPTGGLDLLVVRSGEDLFREAEGLALLDPAAVLVPGGLSEAALPLSRAPLATFAAASPREIAACRTLVLSEEAAAPVVAAASCPEGDAAVLARCIVTALGGSRALDPCGDGLIEYVRQVGPPDYAVGLGDVALLGLSTAPRPAAERAEQWVRLGGRLVGLGLAPSATSRTREEAQASWLGHTLRYARQALILSGLPVPDRAELTGLLGLPAPPASERLAVLGPSSELAGPARVRLRVSRRQPPPGPSQLLGLDPGRLELAGLEARAALPPAELSSRGGEDQTLIIEARDPPQDALRLRVLVPQRPGGWQLSAEGRSARLVGGWPASGDLCSADRALLFIEVAPGPAGPLRLRLSPGRSEELGLEALAPPSPITLGAEVTLRARLDDELAASGGEAQVFWDLGDWTSAQGQEVRHRFYRNGPARICALAVTADGRARSARLVLDVRRWNAGSARQGSAQRTAGLSLIALALLGLLMGSLRGNILRRGRRLG